MIKNKIPNIKIIFKTIKNKLKTFWVSKKSVFQTCFSKAVAKHILNNPAIFLCQTLLLLKIIWKWKHLPNWIGTLEIQLPEMESYGEPLILVWLVV